MKRPLTESLRAVLDCLNGLLVNLFSFGVKSGTEDRFLYLLGTRLFQQLFVDFGRPALRVLTFLKS